MTLVHTFPTSNQVQALVNVSLVLESLRPGTMELGTWVHVVGYLAFSKAKTDEPCSDEEVHLHQAHVQALLLFPSGPMDISQYEEQMSKSAALKKIKKDNKHFCLAAQPKPPH